MRLPNLLATTRGRLTAFFCLYLTEGLPLGFAATAIATQLRRQGVGPAEIGLFVGSFYLPWAFKWAFGPIVDTFASDRLGRRRGWILGTQLMMAITLMSTVMLKLPEQLALFTMILLVHNSFAAMQDVAIDALAVNTLHEDERGLANGLMFAGAAIGQVVGGAGVLFLSGYTGFQPTFFFVAACILAVTVLVVLPLREPAGPPRAPVVGPRLRAAGREMRDFAVSSFRSFLGSRGAFSGLFYALLPPGAMCLGLALQSNLAVELGMNDDQVAWLNLCSGGVNAAFMVIGGRLSDRFGRRKMNFIYIAMMGLPVLYLANVLAQHGWIMPVALDAANRPEVPAALLTAFWIAVMVYNATNGLMYGTNAAMYMDVTNPRVAGTQFTAYMALMNLTIAYSAIWQGIAIEAWGYPKTMVIDALFGISCLLLIPLMRKANTDSGYATDGLAAPRARGLALLLGLACLAWLPYSHWKDAVGAAQPIVSIVFTLAFVGSAVFLLAGAAVLGGSARQLSRVAPWVALLLLAMHARNHLGTIAGWLGTTAEQLQAFATPAFNAIALLGGIVLLLHALQPWDALRRSDAPEGAAA